MGRDNYPGGFEAETIIVMLYSDGRMNFTLGEFVGGRKMLDKIDQDNLSRCKAHSEIDVSGMDWCQICRAAEKEADRLRGCTWDEWTARGNPAPVDGHDRWHLFREELTPAGPQLVIPGCEKRAPDTGKPVQMGLW